MKKFIGIISGAVALVGMTTIPASANPMQTRMVAIMACSGEGFMVMNPDYYGRTRSGLDIWICIESGPAQQAFAAYNPGPYPVLVCNMMNCKVVDMTY